MFLTLGPGDMGETGFLHAAADADNLCGPAPVVISFHGIAADAAGACVLRNRTPPLTSFYPKIFQMVLTYIMLYANI